ncbi:hypothetical protein PC110_g20987 [Phytophthora cactorum]|uniref:Reverse transcriptase domain-containing protein n=1 Tax=Phytophthora cactorum TaxID=29920 RepID=A0A329RGY3_9STRA|nr:hypothetical protein PC110_g20987 [Phytophthora cactorum]
MLAAGVIEEGDGAWGFPVVHVKKKDGEVRFCVDDSALNKITRKDVYPLPRIDETLEALDEIVVYTRGGIEQHVLELACVLERLQAAGLTLKLKQCVLATTSMKYLGHKLSSEGVRLLDHLVTAVREFPKPKDAVEVKSSTRVSMIDGTERPDMTIKRMSPMQQRRKDPNV